MNPRIWETPRMLELKRYLGDWFSLTSLIWHPSTLGPSKVNRFSQQSTTGQRQNQDYNSGLHLLAMLSLRPQDSQDLHSLLATGHNDSLVCVRTLWGPATENSAHAWHKLKKSVHVIGQSPVTWLHVRAQIPFGGCSSSLGPMAVFFYCVGFLEYFTSGNSRWHSTWQRGIVLHHFVSAQALVLIGLTWVTCPCIIVSPWGWWMGRLLWLARSQLCTSPRSWALRSTPPKPRGPAVWEERVPKSPIRKTRGQNLQCPHQDLSGPTVLFPVCT